MKFGEWIKGQLSEIKLGSDGTGDSQITQTTKATTQVAQNWMGQDKNAPQQAQLVQSQGIKSALAPKLMDAGAMAVQQAPRNMAAATTAPNVASFIQSSLNLPTVIKTPKPGQVKMMSKE